MELLLNIINRSITIMDGRIDSIILLAAQKAGLDVSSCFPSDLVIWVNIPWNYIIYINTTI